MRYQRVEDTTWPVVDEETAWRMRYGPDANLSAANVYCAYAYLTDPNRSLKDAIASLRRARKAHEPQ